MWVQEILGLTEMKQVRALKLDDGTDTVLVNILQAD